MGSLLFPQQLNLSGTESFLRQIPGDSRLKTKPLRRRECELNLRKRMESGDKWRNGNKAKRRFFVALLEPDLRETVVKPGGSTDQPADVLPGKLPAGSGAEHATGVRIL
jgi:hypothetical protein